MASLTQDLSIDGEMVHVDGPLLVGKPYHLENEIVLVRGSVTLTYTDVTQGNRWRVARGHDSTAKATHSSGAALTLARVYEAGEAGPGGALTVTDGVTIVEATTVSFIADSVTDEGSGEAAVANTTLRGPDGAAGEGGEVEALAAGANDAGAVTVAGGVAIAGKNGGTARIQGGSGNGGGAEAAFISLEGGASDGSDGRIEAVGAEIAFTTDAMGFFSTGAVARPQVPASPTEQDIVDALVALGLITQAP